MRARGAIADPEDADIRREQVDSMVYHYQAGQGREAAIQWAIEQTWKHTPISLIAEGGGFTTDELKTIFTSRGVPFQQYTCPERNNKLKKTS